MDHHECGQERRRAQNPAIENVSVNDGDRGSIHAMNDLPRCVDAALDRTRVDQKFTSLV